VSDPPQDVPLAFCDRRTIRDADISPRTGVLSPKNSEGFPTPYFTIGGIHANPEQRWHYYSNMRPDEMLVFTGQDTAYADGWKVAHAAFDNRHNDAGAKPRESIEARFYAYWR
jgi:hypothetical protein